MMARYQDGSVEVRGEKHTFKFKGTVTPYKELADKYRDVEYQRIEFPGRPPLEDTGLCVCPRCGCINDNNLPVVVGDGVENGGCRECFGDCGRSDLFSGSIVLEVLTGESVSVPVWW